MNILKNEAEMNHEQAEATNKLLVEMVRNQKVNTQNLVKVFIATIACYTLLLMVMVIGFFVYESQFDVVETETETVRYEQETSSEGDGDAVGIINNNGDWSYGEGETGSDDN